jgi:hypothetical protein
MLTFVGQLGLISHSDKEPFPSVTATAGGGPVSGNVLSEHLQSRDCGDVDQAPIRESAARTFARDLVGEQTRLSILVAVIREARRFVIAEAYVLAMSDCGLKQFVDGFGNLETFAPRRFSHRFRMLFRRPDTNQGRKQAPARASSHRAAATRRQCHNDFFLVPYSSRLRYPLLVRRLEPCR